MPERRFTAPIHMMLSEYGAEAVFILQRHRLSFLRPHGLPPAVLHDIRFTTHHNTPTTPDSLTGTHTATAGLFFR